MDVQSAQVYKLDVSSFSPLVSLGRLSRSAQLLATPTLFRPDRVYRSPVHIATNFKFAMANFLYALLAAAATLQVGLAAPSFNKRAANVTVAHLDNSTVSAASINATILAVNVTATNAATRREIRNAPIALRVPE
ncbi:hypothetical protein BJ170DRAFT_644319 [Xylariales sp. AK1849]|nr:hypothetical protein BJ170DRAFT_644319 [Xylariales sp. AK1849]